MSYMNICLRDVTSPTLARGIPCPTLILVYCDRGVRSPTLIYKLERTCLDYYAYDISSILGLKVTKRCPHIFLI